MSTGGAPFDNVPNELVYQMLEHLTIEQILAVTRVQRRWSLIGEDIIKKKIREEFPLIGRDVLKELSVPESIALLHNHRAIYVALAKENDVPAVLLQREALTEQLKAFATGGGSADFNNDQIVFLKPFAVANGFISGDDAVNKEQAVLLAARIGNLKKLKEESEEKREKLPWGEVLLEAAKNGHLECVKYLIEKLGNEISNDHKRNAIGWTARNNQPLCMHYLVEKIGETVSEGNVKKAFEWTVENGYAECMACLVERYPKAMSADDKLIACINAARKGHLTCMAYLIEKADVTEIGGVLSDAAQCGRLECVKYLIEKYGTVIEKKHKEEALRHASQGNHEECVQYLKSTLTPASSTSRAQPITPMRDASNANSNSNSDKKVDDGKEVNETAMPYHTPNPTAKQIMKK